MSAKPEMTVMISFRISEEQNGRLKEVIKLIRKQHPYMKVADIYRELLGVLDTGAVSSEYRALLKGESWGAAPSPRQSSKIAVYKANEDEKSKSRRKGRS